MDLYLRMSRKGPLNFVNVEPALKSSWWAHCCTYISLIKLPFALFCHRKVSCTIITMVFYIQIIIRSRLDQSVEENQDLKVRGGQMKGKERFWVKISLQTLSYLILFWGGRDRVGQYNRWRVIYCVRAPTLFPYSAVSLQECRYLLPWDDNSLTWRALTILGWELFIISILAVNKSLWDSIREIYAASPLCPSQCW